MNREKVKAGLEALEEQLGADIIINDTVALWDLVEELKRYLSR